jgi:hypothetical protein
MRRELNVASSARALFALVILAWLTPSIEQVSVTTCHNPSHHLMAPK